MDTMWSLLGIEPTDDKKAIRKAFAAQSRLHHPEEEPEYFMALNQAYKAALEHGTSGESTAKFQDAWQESGQRKSESFQERMQKEAENRKPLRGNSTAESRSAEDKTAEAEDRKPLHGSRTAEGGSAEETAENGTAESVSAGDETAENKKAESMEATDDKGSLLKQLEEAAEQAIKKSMEKGALHDFIVLFENPKQAKQADTWKHFFLSEAFLKEQFSEEFGKGLFTYLSGQALFPSDNLPMGLLQELAIAYAFIPHFAGEEYFDGLKYPKEWYKVSVENTFPARRYAAEIFNRQGRECDLKSMTGRILRQPANKVRHNAFSDYLTMKEMSRDGRLTERERDVWQHVLGACQPYYLFERNGKKIGGADYESRSECVVKLYVQWLKDEQLPKEVLLFLYKKLDFRTLDRSSTRGLYSALKEEVLRQLPQAEEVLFGEEGKEQRVTKLYRIYSAIINDNQNNYDKYIYGETPEIRDRSKAFFALPEWEQLKNENVLFQRIYSASKRIVMPRTVAETLVGHLGAGDFPEPERTELTESLLRSLSTERMCRELDYRCEFALGSTDLVDIGASPDFWQYYLMRGFGFRHTKIRGSWEEDFIYVMDGQCYLPAYINYIYAPSRAWQRRFVGFDEDREEIGDPVSIVCPMPGNRKLRVEFHYHYCLYFVDEAQATAPVLAFSELQENADSLKKPEDFFFLLAVTAIEDSDRNTAQKLIEDWLKRIPVHPFIIPTVARLLAADNDRITIVKLHATEAVCKEAGQHIPAPIETAENRAPEAVLYSEQERFCFRALVSAEGLSIWRQMDYGWQDIIFRSAKLGWRKCEEYTWKEYRLVCEAQSRTKADGSESIVPEGIVPEGIVPEGIVPESGTRGNGAPQNDLRESGILGSLDTPEGRKAAARSILYSLRQPRPRIRAAYSLDGMDAVQKTAKILEAMGRLENMEGYCVLRYGAKKEKRHNRVFYGALAPFGFDLKTQSMSYESSRNYLMQSSNTKIKEPKRLVGRFGWGFKYSPSSDYGPMYVYQGESGRFYAYGAIRMHCGDSLDQLLADFFQKEWEGVTEAVAYEGCLTVSRLDHRLEYCYTQEDLQQSMGSLRDTAADRFTVFGGYGMWMEFVRWMDEVLNLQLPEWVNAIVVGLDWERGGALTFAGLHEDEDYSEAEEIGEKGDRGFGDLYLPRTPLLVWAKGMDRRDRAQFLAHAVQWYVDCGRFAENTDGRNIKILVNG